MENKSNVILIGDEIFHFSVSQLEMLSRCGEQYYQRYIKKNIKPPGVALVVGKSVDKGVSANMDNKKDKKALLPRDEVTDTTRDTFENEWKSGIKLTEDEAKEGMAKTKKNAAERSIKMSGLHYDRFAEHINPTHVQRKCQFRLKGIDITLDGKTMPVHFLGYVDIQEGNVAIRDTKTSQKLPNASAADESLQLTAYALFSRVLDEKPVDWVTLDYVVCTPKMNMNHKTLPSVRSDNDFRIILRRIENAIKVLQAGTFVPASQGAWQCSPNWCGYFASCPYVRNPVAFTVPDIANLKITSTKGAK